MLQLVALQPFNLPELPRSKSHLWFRGLALKAPSRVSVGRALCFSSGSLLQGDDQAEHTLLRGLC